MTKLKGLKLNGYGAARNYPTNSEEPMTGGFVKTSESSAGHIAVVMVVNDTTITIEEANFYRGKLTRRVIPRDSAVIRGYINN